jgi:hypothetical protein
MMRCRPKVVFRVEISSRQSNGLVDCRCLIVNPIESVGLDHELTIRDSKQINSHKGVSCELMENSSWSYWLDGTETRDLVGE